MPTVASPREIRADFDAIAALSPEAAEPGGEAAWVLANLPGTGGRALEIGCGVGDLARRLAPHFDATEAIDLSEGMIAEARRRTAPDAPVTFACAEMFEWLRQRPAAYDCIVSVATLHHVDLRDALDAMREALRPGGRLLVVDLYERSGPRHFFTNLLAFSVGGIRAAAAVVRGRSSWKLRRAYRRHGRNETYLTVAEAARIAADVLPGARVTATLVWRYRLLWEKPSA